MILNSNVYKIKIKLIINSQLSIFHLANTLKLSSIYYLISRLQVSGHILWNSQPATRNSQPVIISQCHEK